MHGWRERSTLLKASFCTRPVEYPRTMVKDPEMCEKIPWMGTVIHGWRHVTTLSLKSKMLKYYTYL